MKCEEIMKRDVECVTPSDTVEAAARKMRDRDVGFLPVCEGATKKVIRAEELMVERHKSRLVVTDDAGRLAGVFGLSDIAEKDARNAARTMRRVSEREARRA